MQSIRDAFGEALRDYGDQYKDVVLVSCDLKVATKSNLFYEKFPERSFEVGISEANAIGISAGLSLCNFKPVLSSFGAFLTGKNVEIRTSIAYNKAPVILVGTHGGLIGPDGATQSGIQDISVMRSMPNFRVFQPSTPAMTKKILNHCLNSKSPCYMRVARNEVPEIYDINDKFIEGEPILIGEKQKYSIISSGPMLHNCLKAKDILLNEHKINTNVIDIPSIKPLKQNSLLNILDKTNIIFTVEDHMIEGGIGSLISEQVSASQLNIRVFSKGLYGFVGSGKPNELEKRYDLDSESIVKFVLNKLAE